MHFYGWKRGLKTGMYYLRTRPAAQAIQFTVDQSKLKKPVSNPTTAQTPTPVATPITTSAPKPAVVAVAAPISPSPSPSPSPPPTVVASLAPTPSNVANVESGIGALSLDERTAKAAAEDPEFAAALERQRMRELEEAKMMCSIENKEACMMCSG